MSKQPKSCVGKDSFHRMNYLYQASKFASNIAINSENISKKKNAEYISTYYSNLMLNVAKKSVLRIDTDIKRNICKGCHGLLIPGHTARVRLRKKPEHHVRWTCLKCNSSRVYNTPQSKDYMLWNENPEALVEILEFNDADEENKTEMLH